MEPDLNALVESHFPEPKPGLNALLFALGAGLLVLFGPTTLLFVTLERPSVGTLVCFVASLLPGASCLVWAAVSGRRMHREYMERYPALRAELLAGRIESVVITTGPRPGVGVTLENGEDLALEVHPDDCLLVRDALQRAAGIPPRPRDPSAIPELEDIADLYLGDKRFRQDFVRGMFVKAELVKQRPLRGGSTAVRVTFVDGSETDLVVDPDAVWRVHGAVARHTGVEP